MRTDEIMVEVHQIGEPTRMANLSFFESIRRLVLASIGAIAMTRDELDQIIRRLAERGQLAQQDAERLLREVAGRLRPTDESRFELPLEAVFDQILSRLNIPSRRDLDELNARVALLTAQVEELTHAKAQNDLRT